MNPVPPVRRVVMFKHGVAFFERAGRAEGSFELSFHKDEMNDVLKSLTAWVEEGEARVGEIAFDKPEDPETKLIERGLKLGAEEGLRGLLAAFRGQRIAVTHGGVRTEGEILGVEATRGENGSEHSALVLRTGHGGVQLVALSHVTGMEFPDAPVQADLALLLDRSRAARAGTARTVRVGVHGKAQDLRVSYIVPAPIWRVTYRVACDGDETVLMAWAIVHNPSDSDLHDISLTLTTGRPVSFQIDLYNPRNVQRAMLEEVVPPPVAAAMPAPMMARKSRAPGAMAEEMDVFAELAAEPDMARAGGMEKRAKRFSSAFEGGTPAADGANRGEFFEYRIATPVSLQRGGSAMVPLLVSKLDAKRQRLWRPGSVANPDIVLSFSNSTGAVLEEGAGVVYEDAVYAGEAMFPYAARGADVKLVFAKDMAVRCRSQNHARTNVGSLRLAQGFVVEELRVEDHWEFSAENDHDEEVEVLIDLPKLANRSADPAHAVPVSSTLTHHTYSLKVPAHGKHSIQVVERSEAAKHYRLGDFSHHDLQRWLEGKFLDNRTLDALKGLLLIRDNIDTAQEQITARVDERDEVYEKQKHIAEQLAILKESGAEGKLRLRYVEELSTAQDKVNTLTNEIKQLNDSIKKLNEKFTKGTQNLAA